MSIDWGKAPVPRPRKCSRCGSDDKTFNVGLRAFQTKGTNTSAKALASRSKSFCEPCAFAVYSELVERLEDAASMASISTLHVVGAET